MAYRGDEAGVGGRAFGQGGPEVVAVIGLVLEVRGEILRQLPAQQHLRTHRTEEADQIP